MRYAYIRPLFAADSTAGAAPAGTPPEARPGLDPIAQYRQDKGITPPAAAPAPEADDAEDAEPVTFEALYGRLNDDEKDAFDGHIKGLKSALDSERQARAKLEKDLKALAKQAGDGSELQQSLQKLQSELGEARKESAFYLGAQGEGVKPAMAKLAFIAAQQDKLIAEDGSVDWKAFKTAYPDLFGASAPTPTPRVNAGAGVNERDPRPKAFDMNEYIRGKAKKSGAV